MSDPTRKLPPELVQEAVAFRDGQREPATPKDASTVLLLRDTAAGLQVYVLRRQRSMAFAGGMYAFPGGSVDPRDHDRAVAWAGPSPQQWATWLVCDEAQARSLVCAAVRETFEESGVLLAGESPDTVVKDTTGADWEADRADLAAHRLAFADFLQQRGLVVRTDLLGAWAHWITPSFEPRRYDTRFFVAALPSGQRTRDVSGEADSVEWVAPGEAVRRTEAGRIRMLPPTFTALREMAGFTDAASVLAAAPSRPMPTVVPEVELIDGEGWLTVPDGILP